MDFARLNVVHEATVPTRRREYRQQPLCLQFPISSLVHEAQVYTNIQRANTF